MPDSASAPRPASTPGPRAIARAKHVSATRQIATSTAVPPGMPGTARRLTVRAIGS
jgi:hypothetical protein